MDRNFFRRIEACFPILDKKLKKRVLDEGLNIYLKDNHQAWEMDCNGFWHRKKPNRSKSVNAQVELAALLGQMPTPSDEAA
jgi:polyphosphate kinase